VASTTPPAAATGSARATTAACVVGLLTPGCQPGVNEPWLDQRLTHEAPRSRTAAAPHSVPATSMMPSAAASGARRYTTATPASTHHAVAPIATPFNAGSRPAAMAMERIGGRTAALD